jgi:YebC/PmpR family DNA-binding regulatory protein
VIVEALTDNRNRTAGDVRHAFSKFGGNLGESGCVGWLFDRVGLLTISAGPKVDLDQLMMDALELGAADVVPDGDVIEVTTDPTAFQAVEEGLRKAGYAIASAEVTMAPKTTVRLEQKDAERMLKMMDAFDELDDVQNVYANFDIPDEIMETLS